MAPLVRGRTRRARVLASAAVAGVVAGAVLTGCSSGPGRSAADAHSSRAAAAPAASTGTAGADLTAGLLPSAAFGPDAQVQTLSARQLHQALAMAGQMRASGAGAQVDPPACGEAVQEIVGQLAAWTDTAAEGAMAGGVVTGEVLGSGGNAATLVEQVGETRTACSGAKVSVPARGTATGMAQDLALDDVRARFRGMDISGVEITVDATAADGTARTVPALAALVRDGERVMALVRVVPGGGTVDTREFSDLLTQAIRQQATLD